MSNQQLQYCQDNTMWVKISSQSTTAFPESTRDIPLWFIRSAMFRPLSRLTKHPIRSGRTPLFKTFTEPRPWRQSLIWRVSSSRYSSQTNQKLQRPPVYFSKSKSQTLQPNPVEQTPLPRYFASEDGTQAAVSPFSPKLRQEPSRWGKRIAYSFFTLGTGLLVLIAYFRASNKEEVPFTDRKRSNILSTSFFRDRRSTPNTRLQAMGLPSLETLLRSSLVLDRDAENEQVRLAYEYFDQLVIANGLHDVQLHVVDEPGMSECTLLSC